MDVQAIVDGVAPVVQDYLSAHLPKLARVVNPLVPIVLLVVLKAGVIAISAQPEVQALKARYREPNGSDRTTDRVDGLTIDDAYHKRTASM